MNYYSHSQNCQAVLKKKIKKKIMKKCYCPVTVEDLAMELNRVYRNKCTSLFVCRTEKQ